jgi:FkbM family methyltransferase
MYTPPLIGKLPLITPSIGLAPLWTSKLKSILNKLKINHGNFEREISEMELSVKFIKPNYTVLELGSNIGRNTLVIASILDNSSNLVTVESDPVSIKHLKENKEINNLNFTIIGAAISDVPIYQYGWNTYTKSEIKGREDKMKKIDVISMHNIYKQSGIHNFDALVIDCEGCSEVILRDNPKLLRDATLIIIENDARDDGNNKIKNIILGADFESVYCGDHPHRKPCFYQVFKKKNIN